MKQQIIKRLQDLEQYSNTKPLVLWCKTPDGEQTATLEEFETNSDYHFLRIISGGTLADCDKILDTIGGEI